MARPELSAELHQLHGTESQRKTSRESMHTGGKPRRPKNLSPVALEKWKEIVRFLAKRRTITPADGPLIELAAEGFARWRMLVDDIQKRGIYVQGEDGEIINPSIKYANQAENCLRAALKELGITPSSRERAKPIAPAQPKKSLTFPIPEYTLADEQAPAVETPDGEESLAAKIAKLDL